MGSKGSGNFSDYPGSSKPTVEDRCAKAFNDSLQDIEQSAYFVKHGSCPPEGTEVRLRAAKRIIVETADGEAIGNLPTARNYLAACINDGFRYAGKITKARNGPPSATISVDIAPVASK